MIRGFHYLALLPAILGLWWFRDRLRSAPVGWVMIVLGTLHTLLLCAWRSSSVTSRSGTCRLLILGGCFWAVAFVAMVGDRLAALTGRAWISGALLLALTAFDVPAALKQLHANRAGHRAAGAWLAEHVPVFDEVVDPFCWAHYYAGRVFLEAHPPHPRGDLAAPLRGARGHRQPARTAAGHEVGEAPGRAGPGGL